MFVPVCLEVRRSWPLGRGGRDECNIGEETWQQCTDPGPARPWEETQHTAWNTHRKERWHHSSALSNHWLCCSSARCLEEPTLTFMFHVWMMISWRQNVWKTKSSRLVSSEDAAEHRHSKCLLVKICQNIIKWRFLKLQTSVSKLWYVSINWFYYQSD